MSDYSTRNIIDFAYDDDGKAFRDALYAEIHDRVAGQFQARKQELAQTFLAPEHQMALQPHAEELATESVEITEDVEQLDEGKMDKMTLSGLWHKHAQHTYLSDQGFGDGHTSLQHNDHAATAIENHVRKHHGNKVADDMVSHSHHHLAQSEYAGAEDHDHHEKEMVKLRAKHKISDKHPTIK